MSVPLDSALGPQAPGVPPGSVCASAPDRPPGEGGPETAILTGGGRGRRMLGAVSSWRLDARAAGLPGGARARGKGGAPGLGAGDALSPHRRLEQTPDMCKGAKSEAAPSGPEQFLFVRMRESKRFSGSLVHGGSEIRSTT